LARDSGAARQARGRRKREPTRIEAVLLFEPVLDEDVPVKEVDLAVLVEVGGVGPHGERGRRRG